MTVRARLQEIRQAVLATPDTVCLERARLLTEADQQFAADPMPLRRAKSFAHVLRHMTLDLYTNPFLAGNTSTAPRAWMLLPEYGFHVPGQAVVENPAFEGFLDGDVVPAEWRAYWRDRAVGTTAGIGHLIINAERLLAGGLDALIAEAEREPTVYARAAALACRAVIEWAGRYAAAAAEAATQEPDEIRAAALRRVATACRRVPAQPARNLLEAVQSLTLVHLAIHIEGHGYSVSPGRVDQLLFPYYRGESEATELLAAFLLKLAANSVWGSHSKTQAITLGGADAGGRDQSNPLTLRLLDAWDWVRVPDPHLFVRWHRHLAPAVKQRALELLAAGCSMPMLVGDEQTVAGLIGAGITPVDAANYAIIGCNELGVPGKLVFDAVSLNEAALLRETVLEIAPAAPAMGALLNRLSQRATDRLRAELPAHAAHRLRLAQQVPTPFTSALLDGCVERGQDFQEATEYPFVNTRIAGFTNLINGLAAIAAVVAPQPPSGWAALAAALADDFCDAEPLRQALLAAPKWGNDDARADGWAVAWLEQRTALLRALAQEPGCPPLLAEMVVRSLHHLEGRDTGATPDGRHAGEPLCDSVGVQTGTAREGLTALLNSVGRLAPARHWPGGYNLNVMLPAMDWQAPVMIEKLRAVVEVFFAQGGQELQINCVSAATLREAQRHPEKHGDLMVRIAGFNALFVKLSPCEQEEIIRRADCA